MFNSMKRGKMRKGNYIGGGDRNIQIYNENGTVNFQMCPEYESLKVAAEQELEKLRGLHQEALQIVNSAKSLQYLIHAILVIWVIVVSVLGFVSNNILSFASIAHEYILKFTLMALCSMLVLGLARMEFEKSYSHFLRKNYYRFNAIDKALTELYALTCQKFADTPLAGNLRKGMDILAALKQDYETFAKKESKRLKVTF